LNRKGNRLQGVSNKGSLTITVFKEAGKPRRFVISSRLIVCSSLFFLLYIVATIYSTNKYFDTRRMNKVQTDTIASLGRDLIKATESLRSSTQRIALLRDYISESRTPGQDSEPAANSTEASLPTVVDIENLKINRDGSTLTVTFRIVNTQAAGEPIGGYVFVLASGEDSDESEAWVYPSSPLKDGLPADYSRGCQFFIQNFIPISSTLSLTQPTDKPLIVGILVYDRNGTLVLEKVVKA
jgi:hypothetical protein